ncbi:uncharacterized protein VICG_01169 [Vittaforma corneae ATCC 50505]|uniref:ABC transporter domain-containing protein n=1 Tax=Vittaforma corneae (strain ATCC 50505) TaxID=993615 RepID=L2GNC4_VITCO|nr:uncharacterized protein VICG_01169 [Vittaforma corneae ATCC 50505]ELA41817.1 hypothetical protein VICG_01169 [Vittaforma corneae ATCC 50505]
MSFLQQFGFKHLLKCFLKIIHCCWRSTNKYYLIGMLCLLPLYIAMDYREVMTFDYLILAFKRDDGYTMYDYATMSVKIFLVKLIIAIFNDIATSEFFYSGLKTSLTDFLGLDWNSFHRYTTGELLLRQYEKGEAVSIIMYGIVMKIVASALGAVLTIVHIIKKTTLNFGLGMLMGSVMHIVIFTACLKTLNAFQHKYIDTKNRSRSLVENESSNFHIVKVYNLNKNSHERIRDVMHARYKAKLGYLVYKSKSELYYKTIEILSNVFVIALYYTDVISGDFLDATVSQICHLCDSLRTFLTSITEFSEYFYLFCTLEQGLIQGEIRPILLDTISKIECDSLSFQALFSNVSFKLEKNQKMAIVGANGSGKTILLRILAGLLDYNGSVRFDGNELYQINRQHLYGLLTFISQADAYSDGSIMSNLKYGNNLSEDEIIGKCRRFNVDCIFSELENGYAKDSSSLGTELSGGQRQRVSFMRGVLRSTPVLIVDDCLSGVNMRDRGVLVENLLSLNDRMIIMTCSRFDFLSKFDKILLLQGDASRAGSFDELEGELRSYFKTNVMA